MADSAPTVGAWAVLRTLAGALTNLTRALIRQADALERIAATQERIFKGQLIFNNMTLEEFDKTVPGAVDEAAAEPEVEGVGFDLNRIKAAEELYRTTYGVDPPEDWDPDARSPEERDVELGPGIDLRAPVPPFRGR